MKCKPIITSLTIAVVLMFLGIGVVAAQEPTEELRVGAEAVARRTATSKHVYLGHGRYQAQIGSAPIHYRDAQGKWQEIDTTLRPQNKGGYAVETNGLKTYLPLHSGGLASVAGRVYLYEAESGALWGATDKTLPPVDVSLSWVPVAWRYADAAGHLDNLAAIQPVAGQAQGDTLTYQDVMPGVNELYRVIPNGLQHQLTLLSPPRAPAGGLSGEIMLDYVMALELPDGLSLYANGAVQPGNFTTGDAIEVRDSQGHPLLMLKAPLAYEAGNRREMARGSYAVWREGNSLRLAWRTPAAWLLAPERHYPLVLDPTAIFTAPYDDTSFSVVSGPGGLSPELWVGGGYRTLLNWWDWWGAPSWPIPAYALLDDDSDDDGRVQLYLADHWGDGSSQFVEMYRISTPWDIEATYSQATGSTWWDTPGGDYDELVALGWVNSTPGYKTFGSIDVRDTVALWRTYLMVYPPLTYGHYPAGFLLKYQTETGAEIKQFASQQTAIPDANPLLIVNYTDGPRALSNQSPVRRRVPSPDYYATPAYSLWWAVGTRMSGGKLNYNLDLHTSSTYHLNSKQESSSPGSGNVSFIVVNQDAPANPHYPLVYFADSYTSEFFYTGDYRIEYTQRTSYFGSGIDPDDSYGPYTMDTDSVIRIWSIYETAESYNCISVVPTSGDARLGVAVFGPDDDYYNRDDALANAVASGGGDSVSIDYIAPSTGVYGLVVWNEGMSGSTTFNIEGCTSAADDTGVFLPIVVKNR
ncbi:MAG: hypothetical protein JXM69_17560 [Anaerolineae bacterium]|nr:hypothetical protein [Anaerolineae bacterium]